MATGLGEGVGVPVVVQPFAAELLFCGIGEPVVKSEPLLLVSVHPPPLRIAAVVLVNVAVGAEPSYVVPVPVP